MSSVNKKLFRPTSPPPPPPPPPPKNKLTRPSNPPPRPSQPPRRTSVSQKEADRFSFLNPLIKAFKLPPPPSQTIPIPAKPREVRKVPKNDLVNLLFPPRSANKPPRTQRPTHMPPQPPRNVSKPPLTSDLYSFFFHPRKNVVKISRQDHHRNSNPVPPTHSRDRAGQLSSFGNSRSCTNLSFDPNPPSTGTGNNDNNGPFNSIMDDIWRLPAPLEPIRRTQRSHGVTFNESTIVRPMSEMTSSNKLKMIEPMKRSVSMGSLNESNWRDEEEGGRECTICCERQVDSVFIPCGHMFACYACATEYWQSKADGGCPICRAPSSGVFRTFSS